MTTVLHVISGLELGGAETTLVNLARELQARGLPQHVVSLRDEGAFGDDLRQSGIVLSTLNLKSAVQAPVGLIHLLQLMRRRRPGIVQGWMYHGNLLAALGHRMAPGRDKRRLLWNLRASNMDAARYARDMRLGAALSAWPDVIIANSEAGAAFHREKGYRARRLEVIVNGIDTERFKPDAEARATLRAELGISLETVVVIHAARVDPMKDHATCLAALAAVPQVRAILVGAGTTDLPLPPNVKALGIRHDVERLYAVADIVVSSSAFGEGFSNALAEGMSVGLTPVATDVGDAGLIVGDTGHVVPPGDPQALAAAVAASATESPVERQSRGAAARARIVERFSMAKAVAMYEDLYRRLMVPTSGS